MVQFLQEYIALLGGFAVLVTALAWLIRSIVIHFLSKDVEKYKSRIASESQLEVERFRAQLQIAAKEHDIRFSKLHEKRAEVISELYALLREAKDKTEYLDLMLMYGKNQKVLRFNEEAQMRRTDVVAKQIVDKCQELRRHFIKHKLYFSKELADKMEELILTISEPSDTYANWKVGELDELCAVISESWSKDRVKVEQTFKLLEDEFREILGSRVEITNAPQ